MACMCACVCPCTRAFACSWEREKEREICLKGLGWAHSKNHLTPHPAPSQDLLPEIYKVQCWLESVVWLAPWYPRHQFWDFDSRVELSPSRGHNLEFAFTLPGMQHLPHTNIYPSTDEGGDSLGNGIQFCRTFSDLVSHKLSSLPGPSRHLFFPSGSHSNEYATPNFNCHAANFKNPCNSKIFRLYTILFRSQKRIFFLKLYLVVFLKFL